MAYVAEWEPKATIKILRAVPLDNTYQNTLYFNSVDEQTAYFMNKTKFEDEFINQTYTRHTGNKIRIEHNAEDLLDCNYVMFQNQLFGTQWYYAFITNVEYINVYTSEITFEIDVMQTWYWNYALRECFVIREHSETDEIGDNLVTENLDTGAYICSNTSQIEDIFNDYAIVIASTQDMNGDLQTIKTSGLTQCCYYAMFSNEDGHNLDGHGGTLLDFLNAIADGNDWEGLIASVYFPTWFTFYQSTSEPRTTEHTIQPLKGFGTFVPKNNKLLTFPYSFLQVECGGKSNTYRYEFFRTGEIKFKLTGLLSAIPCITLTPLNYNGQEENYAQELVMDDFPKCNIAIDSFKAYLAQHGVSSGLAIAGSAAALGLGIASAVTSGGMTIPAVAGLVAGTVGAAQQINEIAVASTKPAQSRIVGTNAIDVARKSLNFYFKQFQILPEYAKIIDDYFTMYGYATNRLKKPNIADKTKKRPHYNYVLLGDIINFSWYETPKGASVPQEDMATIIQNYKRGITFWNTDTDVGDYSVDNKPQGTPGA